MKKRAEELFAEDGKEQPLSETDKTDLFKEEESKEDKKSPAGAENPGKIYPLVTGLRHWSTPLYTRIVVDVEDKVSYRQNCLRKIRRSKNRKGFIWTSIRPDWP